MFLRVVILALAAICCTARVIDGTEMQPTWERSGKFESDTMLTEEQTRNGVTDPTLLWRNKTVTFFIDPLFTAAEQTTILNAVNQFNARTTVRLVRTTSSPNSGDWVHVTGENSGCWSYLGRQGGRQQLNLQPNGCLRAGIVLREFLRALGFIYMHTVPERDNWVEILWQNIQPGMEQHFHIYQGQINSSGIPYDYGSVTHYGAFEFSVNGQPTIRTTNPPGTPIGQTNEFSLRDIQKLEAMYRNV